MERIEFKVESFLRTGQGDFDALAIELFAYQYEKNQPYQSYCRSIGVHPDSVKNWRD